MVSNLHSLIWITLLRHIGCSFRFPHLSWQSRVKCCRYFQHSFWRNLKPDFLTRLKHRAHVLPYTRVFQVWLHQTHWAFRLQDPIPGAPSICSACHFVFISRCSSSDEHHTTVMKCVQYECLTTDPTNIKTSLRWFVVWQMPDLRSFKSRIKIKAVRRFVSATHEDECKTWKNKDSQCEKETMSKRDAYCTDRTVDRTLQIGKVFILRPPQRILKSLTLQHPNHAAKL